MDQRSPEWFAARCGRVTASRVADIVAKTKTGYSSSRENYMAQLVVERLTGKPTEMFSNAAMEWGTTQEPNAKAAYSARTGEFIEEVGFIPHHAIPMSGASPDGYVGEGLIEVKCPNTATHLEYVLTQKPPHKYMVQMQWQMAVTGAPWCDFVSFDPRLDGKAAHLQLLVVRIARDDQMITLLETEVKAFLKELDEKITQLEKVKL